MTTGQRRRQASSPKPSNGTKALGHRSHLLKTGFDTNAKRIARDYRNRGEGAKRNPQARFQSPGSSFECRFLPKKRRRELLLGKGQRKNKKKKEQYVTNEVMIPSSLAVLREVYPPRGSTQGESRIPPSTARHRVAKKGRPAALLRGSHAGVLGIGCVSRAPRTGTRRASRASRSLGLMRFEVMGCWERWAQTPAREPLFALPAPLLLAGGTGGVDKACGGGHLPPQGRWTQVHRPVARRATKVRGARPSHALPHGRKA